VDLVSVPDVTPAMTAGRARTIVNPARISAARVGQGAGPRIVVTTALGGTKMALRIAGVRTAQTTAVASEVGPPATNVVGEIEVGPTATTVEPG